MKVIDGSVTSPKGFKAAACSAEVKYKGRTDMAMIYSQKPCRVAGTFTRNIVKAAPVLWDRDLVENSEYVQAVVVNSGIANACTGEEGLSYCRETAKEASALLGVPEKAVLLGSTGVIGMQLPIDRIKKGVAMLKDALGEDVEKGHEAARAIMTTDTKPKEVAVTIDIQGKTVTVAGMCKGSGMIHPNMCTMLAYVTTDVCISKELLTKCTKASVDDSFNMISVDGDTSTNDTYLVIANGMAENPEITEENEDYKKFADALLYVNETLAKKMAGDGEGATALFEVKVVNADTVANAKVLAKSVITSSLTKAAIFGHDANWGRILCALGYSGVTFNPDMMELYFESKKGKIQIFKNGKASDYSEEEATAILSEPEVTVIADMKMGDCAATAWGCDLTYDYVKINADYRS